MSRTMTREATPPAKPSSNGSAPSPVSLASPKHRRPSWVVAGVVVVAMAAMVGTSGIYGGRLADEFANKRSVPAL